jgi:hypothetical protein
LEKIRRGPGISPDFESRSVHRYSQWGREAEEKIWEEEGEGKEEEMDERHVHHAVP